MSYEYEEATEIFTVGELRKAIRRSGVTVTGNTPSLFGLVVKVSKASGLEAFRDMDPATELDSAAIDFGDQIAIKEEHDKQNPLGQRQD